MLPLDLHVLGLPLAFILSQDQTLHCISLNVCPTPGIPSPCIKMVHFLILRCRYNMYMNFLILKTEHFPQHLSSFGLTPLPRR